MYLLILMVVRLPLAPADFQTTSACTPSLVA